MAKKEKEVRKKKKGGAVEATGKIKPESLRSFGKRNITLYATETNLNRAVPDLFDGLKPVQRRVLWSASHESRVVKTAAIVGDCLAKYHPHGDKSVADTIEGMIMSAPTPAMFGVGNWGGLVDNAAAMRYTNCALTGYGRLFFNQHYIDKKVTQFVPNYDGSKKEPVTLPAQMPHVLMTGAEGIGMGITTCLPSFTPESLLRVMRLMLKGKGLKDGEPLKRMDFAKILKPNLRWGGRLVDSQQNREAWRTMFESTEATVQFEANLEVDENTKSIIIREWPPGLTPEKFVAAVRGLKETKDVYNEIDVEYRVECRKDYNMDQFHKFVEKVQKLTRRNRAFKLNVTRRTAKITDGVVSYKTEMLALPVPDMIAEWLRMRIKLEITSLENRIINEKAAIHYSKLLIYAADKLDIIFKALRRKDTEEFLVKHLKRPIEDVKTILELKVRQLSSLDQDTWTKKLREQEKHLKQLEVWLKSPKLKVLEDLDVVERTLAEDVKAAKARADLAEGE